MMKVLVLGELDIPFKEKLLAEEIAPIFSEDYQVLFQEPWDIVFCKNPKPLLLGKGGPQQGIFFCTNWIESQRSLDHWNVSSWNFHERKFKDVRTFDTIFSDFDFFIKSLKAEMRAFEVFREVLQEEVHEK